jgi:uncharacterized protein
MDILALIIAVVLIIYLMQVGFPRPARRRSIPRSFVRSYLHRIIASWIILCLPVLVLLHDGVSVSNIGLLWPSPWWPTMLALLGVIMLFTAVLVMHLRTEKEEQFLTKTAVQRLRLALPRTSSERLVWVGVSINAGIWEEIVFRGFLPWYVVHHVTIFGFFVPFVWAAIFSLLLFSLAHLYQGWGGVLGVGFVGMTLAVLYALTGNLFASILWHILFDVRFSFGTLTMEGTIHQPAHAAEVRSNRVAEGGLRPDWGKWYHRRLRRLRQQKDWNKQPYRQEGEETTSLDASKMVAERERSLLLERLEGESESTASVLSDVLQEASGSKEAVHADTPPGVPERPVRGRAAREQLLHDMGGET